MINLEQLGRTDSTEGDQSRRANITGFDLSDMGELFVKAGELAGVEIYKDEQYSDRYFAASDNISLAQMGVPAHTLSVAYQFPDYHGAGDDWQKIDFSNMAQTVKAIAIAALMVTQSDQVLHWNTANPKAARYLEAWKKLQ
jgi:hypothetical protein